MDYGLARLLARLGNDSEDGTPGLKHYSVLHVYRNHLTSNILLYE